ncbi:Outer membrane receptor proteins, mostly Fe transport [Solimonas aquatica]|uniref:Outer membrane receptor proteins, mostly Fe transport n=1 Tax=Solimonas aquatica TaxID=489703 RepID=A0A1H9E1X2_9GAMM|nr:TonB-dependent receptor [Solimonas aquatica]SEQ19675.1 Outer membrane receptor proteins, mostly Fe transport [Solimonas aquatica]
MHRRRIKRPVAGVLAVFAVQTAQAQNEAPANPAAALEIPTVTVIATTPLPGLGTPVEEVPANVRVLTGAQIEQQRSTGLADYMNQNLGGVFVNETQNNPYQPDVNFRGFTASPLLGTPQGLSVYVDGVRVNEAFGDVVNWDLLPQSAISSVSLMPGSNPVFGLNTLGGALSVQTKSGKQYPGTALEASGGSFGRSSASLETGGAQGDFDYFLTASLFDEDGWRDFSPSNIKQAFGKLGWENESTDFDLSYAWADTDLTGNGLAPVAMLKQRYEAVFTAPDNTRNQLNMVNARASHFLSEQWLLGGNVYFRGLRTHTFNGDVNDDYADDYESLDCENDPNSSDCQELAEENAANNRTRVAQRSYGATLQLSATAPLLGRDNQFTLGGSYDNGRSDFKQYTQEATLTAQRRTEALGDAGLDVSLIGRERNHGVYFTDTWSPYKLLHLTASLRYNQARVELADRIGTALNGEHDFHRLNPALGFTYTPDTTLTLYVDYNEGNRVPTPIELGCADPTQPCKLPNAFAADPPLKQVVAKTWEAGGRGSLAGKRLNWSAALFRTLNRDDIQFISSSISGAGYFANVGRTERRGVELGLSGQWAALQWHAEYVLVDARYLSDFSVVSENNSTADADGFIEVADGNRIPLIPRHGAKLGGEYELLRGLSLGANLMLSSGVFLRGNENNRHQAGDNPQGSTFDDPGRIGGYGLLNLYSNYRFARRWEVFARLNNVFDRRFATSGQLAGNPFDDNGAFQANPEDWHHVAAIAPAAPRAVWAGLSLKLGALPAP